MENDDPTSKVFQRDDGYFGLRGEPESRYYASREVAERVAAELAAGVAPRESDEVIACAEDEHAPDGGETETG